MIPQNGLFHLIFYPHYLCEWIEWTGYWIMAGSSCTPARNFLFNEIATMLPRALHGKEWYVRPDHDLESIDFDSLKCIESVC